MNKAVLFLLDLFFPNRCLLCDEFIVYDSFVCEKCNAELEKYYSQEGSYCGICGKNICEGHDNLYFRRIISCYNYEDVVKQGIYSLKGSSKSFGYHIGTILAEKIKSDSIMSKADYIIAVPMSKDKLRKRGYNQAYVIAKEISERTDIELLSNILFKKPSQTQHLLSAEERMKNAEAFYCKDVDLSGKKIIICDDVLTTGSTMNKCAQLLKSLNADEIYGAAGAVTVRRTSAQSENIKSAEEYYRIK